MAKMPLFFDQKDGKGPSLRTLDGVTCHLTVDQEHVWGVSGLPMSEFE